MREEETENVSYKKEGAWKSNAKRIEDIEESLEAKVEKKSSLDLQSYTSHKQATAPWNEYRYVIISHASARNKAISLSICCPASSAQNLPYLTI